MDIQKVFQSARGRGVANIMTQLEIGEGIYPSFLQILYQAMYL